MRKPKGYWTRDHCQEEAQKYKTKKEFNINSRGAYNAAKKNNWLKEICDHMISTTMPSGYWTKERCFEIALKYETRSDFKHNDYKAYNAACSHHWLDEICLHMPKVGNKLFRCIYVYEFSDKHAYIGLTYSLKNRDKIRKNNINDAVTKYIKLTNLTPEIKQLSEYIYIDIAKQLECECIEFYKTLGWQMLNSTKGGEIGGIPNTWTEDDCHKEALKFNTRTNFKLKKYSAYTAAEENGWLDKICSHMVFINTNHTIDDSRIEALKYNNKPDFQRNCPAIYTWAIRNKILDDICQHMVRKYKPNGYWTKEHCQEEALKYKTKIEFYENCGGGVDAAKRNGWYDEICIHMIKSPRSHYLLWNKECCYKEALKYNSRNEFKINAGGAYNAARRNNWLDEICSHMIELKHKWTLDECRKEAIKYKTRTEFQDNCNSAYDWALRNNTLDDICKHMKSKIIAEQMKSVD